MFDLEGKVALVTGASGGIGRAIATLLHAQGAKVVLSGTRQPALDAVAEELGERVYTVACNLSDAHATEQLVGEAETKAGGLDIVVCNAGITKDGLVLRMKEEDFDTVLDINLKATFLINREAVKRMIRKKWGRIINISSIVGVMGNPGQANYVASKAGMIGMTKAIAAEVASRGVTVNCVAPGFIDTPMTEVLTDEQKERLLKSIPAGRLGLPEDIANATLFLASEGAGYITGHTLHVNGGMLMV